MKIGVLALQGGFAPHVAALEEIGHQTVEVRTVDDLARVDGLVLPGGESTTQLSLLERFGLEDAVAAFLRSGHPVLCTCAGLILAARRIVASAQRSFDALDVAVARNAYGPQVESFEARADEGALELVFIRAPRIVELGAGVEVLARHRGEPVLVRQGAVLGASFHPELTADRRVHAWAFGAASHAAR